MAGFPGKTPLPNLRLHLNCKKSLCSISMRNPKLLFLQFLFLCLTFPALVTANRLARPRCRTDCGGVPLYFPFGIGRNCSLNEWYSIDCNNSSSISFKPYLSKLKLEVLRISLSSQTVTVRSPVTYLCNNGSSETRSVIWNSTNLAGSPFFFSKYDNKLMFVGCGNAILHQQNKVIISGCMSTCHKSIKRVSSCYGISCCETSIPFFLSEYYLNLTNSGSIGNLSSCSSAFLTSNFVDSLNRRYESDSLLDRRYESVPVALTWTITKSDEDAISWYCYPYNASIQLESGKSIQTMTCSCSTKFDVNSKCFDYLTQAYRQIYSKKNLTAVIVGVATSVGMLFLVAASFVSYKLLKRRRDKKIKEQFFKRNGGLLLQNQLSNNDSVIEKTTIFMAAELEKATDNFNENRILGRGGQGTVYKGMLTDGRIVAIKKSKLADETQLEQFINEVVVLSQVVHKNVVKLLGCCLETEVPLLVYEFIPNGTLFQFIHNESDHEFLTWNMRLRIATEVAGALAYLHSAVSIPIYHRDIKSSNILLDEKYVAKVSDFGTSRSIAVDKTHITTLVKGTFGYLDPEYFQSSQFTEKSDVYSFGVVLVELLTGQKAISWAGTSEDSNLSLATRFLISMEENSLQTILDVQVLDHDNKEDIIAVAKLAERCLNLNGRKRPTMKEVAFELERIRISKIYPTIPSNFHGLDCIEEESIEFSDTIPTSSSGSSTIRSTSDTSPLLFNTV